MARQSEVSEEAHALSSTQQRSGEQGARENTICTYRDGCGSESSCIMHHDGAKWRQCRDRGFQLSHGGRRVECHVSSSCARRISSKSSSNSVKITGTCLLSSWQRRFRRAARKNEKIAMQDVPASRLSNMHRSGGAIYNLDLLPEANRLDSNSIAVDHRSSITGSPPHPGRMIIDTARL